MEALPCRPLISRTNAISPVVSCNKVATWIANNRHFQLLECLNDVFTETILVRQRVARIVDAAVNATSHVPRLRSMRLCAQSRHGLGLLDKSLLCKTAVNIVVDLCDLVGWVNAD